MNSTLTRLRELKAVMIALSTFLFLPFSSWGVRSAHFNTHVMWGGAVNNCYCSVQIFNPGPLSQKVKINGQMRINALTYPMNLINCNTHPSNCPVDLSQYFTIAPNASVTYKAAGDNATTLPLLSPVECSGEILVLEDQGAVLGSGTMVGSGGGYNERNYSVSVNGGRPF